MSGDVVTVPAGVDPAGVTVQPSRPLTVHQAIARVMLAMAPVGKDERGPANQGGYAYRGIEAVTAALQKLCGEHGVVIWPQAHVVDAPPSIGMKEGWLDWRIEVTWGVAGPDGSVLDPAPVTVGIGRDNVDKGVNKAMTQAYKYLLLQLFMIANGGQGAHDTDGIDYEAGRETEADRGPALLGAAKAKLIAADIAALPAAARERLAAAWVAEDPMTGQPFLPTADGKPALRFVLAEHEQAVMNLIGEAARAAKAAAEAPESPQDSPRDDPGTPEPGDAETATQDVDPKPRNGDEPF